MRFEDLDDADLHRLKVDLEEKQQALEILAQSSATPTSWVNFRQTFLNQCIDDLPLKSEVEYDEEALTEEWRAGVDRNLRLRRLADINFQRSHDNATSAAILNSMTIADKRTKIILLTSCFNISVIDNFGVINGCRIGRRTNVWVGADEINSGLGYMATLINTLQRKIASDTGEAQHPAGSKHSILPRGKQSAILVDDDEQGEYPLYLVDGLIAPYFNIPRLNIALEALLEILKDIIVLTRQSLYAELPVEPFPIDASTGSVKGLSIKYVGEEVARWTESMKLLLIDVKWFLGELARWQFCHFSHLVNDNK